MEKVYDIILHGAVECGYTYESKSIAICPTLEDAKAFLASDAQICHTGLETWHEFAVVERTLGKTCDDNKLVFFTKDVNVRINDAYYERAILHCEYRALERLAEKHDVLVGILLDLYDEGYSVEEIFEKYEG